MSLQGGGLGRGTVCAADIGNPARPTAELGGTADEGEFAEIELEKEGWQESQIQNAISVKFSDRGGCSFVIRDVEFRSSGCAGRCRSHLVFSGG